MQRLLAALAPADVFASAASEEDKTVITELLAPKRCEVRSQMPDAAGFGGLGRNNSLMVTKDGEGEISDPERKGTQAWINGIIFWSIHHAHTLAVEEEKARGKEYDFIVRVRYDLVFQEETVALVQQLLKELEGTEPTVIVPEINNFGGVNDQFGFGNRKGMQAYADTWNNYHSLLFADRAPRFITHLQTEKCLEATLKEQGVTVIRKEGLKARILREENGKAVVQKDSD